MAESALSQFRRWYGMKPVALRTLIAINVVFYVVWLVVLSRIGVTANFVGEHLALNTELPTPLFEAWQLITYNFLHLGTSFWGLIHLAFNMLWIYWMGMEIEEMRGPQTLTAIYLLGGLMGGLLSVLVHNTLLGPALIHGASASVLAVMAAAATWYPNRKIMLLFIPFGIPLKWLVIGFLVLDLLFLGSSNTAVAAHLGGALGGFLFVRGTDAGLDLSAWANVFFRSRRSASYSAPWMRGSGRMERVGSPFGSKKAATKPSKSSPLRRVTAEDLAGGPTVVAESGSEVDRILDKILEQGYDSLTAAERKILDEASQK